MTCRVGCSQLRSGALLGSWSGSCCGNDQDAPRLGRRGRYARTAREELGKRNGRNRACLTPSRGRAFAVTRSLEPDTQARVAETLRLSKLTVKRANLHIHAGFTHSFIRLTTVFTPPDDRSGISRCAVAVRRTSGRVHVCRRFRSSSTPSPDAFLPPRR
jgi:hypothetical protein